MPVIHPGIFRVIKKFPEQREDVFRLFYECDGFRNTCDDYNRCNDAIIYWNKQSSEQSLVRKAEYEELFRSLEAELLTYLRDDRLRRKA